MVALTALLSRPIVEVYFYGSLIPIANNNKNVQAKTNPFPTNPIIKRIMRLDINQENIANKIPITDKVP